MYASYPLAAREQQAVNEILYKLDAPRKRLGKGTFSSFYASHDPEKAIRIMFADPSQADFYDGAVSEYFSEENQRHLPRKFEDFDEVNDWLFEERVRLDVGNVTVSLVERLQPLNNRSRAHHLNKAIHLKLAQLGFKEIAFEGYLKCKDPDAYLRKNVPLEIADFHGYVDSLGLASRDYSVKCDKLSHDFMVRPSTGELVISDPWFEPTVLSNRNRAIMPRLYC